MSARLACNFHNLKLMWSFQANLKDVVYPSDATQSGHRRIKHDLHFCWTPGGEDLLPNGNMLTAPWWVPLMSKGSEALKGGAPATVKAYMSRRDLQHSCHDLLPMDIFGELGSVSLGARFTNGWYCASCGRLNEQVHLRHRFCTGSSCKVRPCFAFYSLI